MPDPDLVTTTLLLSRLHDTRDDEAWRQFDARFRGVILAAALRLGLSRSDAEEAAQETMFQALRDYQAGKYDRARGRLSSWIVSIAHHRIADLQRVRRPGGGVHDREAGHGIAREPDVAEAFERALERHIFEQAWETVRTQGRLAPATLAAFELTALRGVPASEAAAECGMSVDQVYVAKNRVAKRLQEAVEIVGRAVRDGL